MKLPSMRQSIIWMVISILLIMMAAACSPEVELQGIEKDKALQFSENAAQNIILGLLVGDYKIFSTSFDDALKVSLNEPAFQNMRQVMSVKLGSYLSYETGRLLSDNNSLSANFLLVYEKSPAVNMRLVMQANESHKVTGLFFDAPELR
jgi:hypothetical protein